MKLAEYRVSFVPRTEKKGDELVDKDYDEGIRILEDMDFRYELHNMVRSFIGDWHWEADSKFLRSNFRVEVDNS